MGGDLNHNFFHVSKEVLLQCTGSYRDKRPFTSSTDSIPLISFPPVMTYLSCRVFATVLEPWGNSLMVWVQASVNDSENSSTVPTGPQTGSPNDVSFATPKHGGPRARTLERQSLFALTAQGGQSRTVNGPHLDLSEVTQRLDRIEASLVSLNSTVQGLVELELPRKKDFMSDLCNLRIAAETVVSRETICSVLLVTVEGVPCYLCPICLKPQRVAAMRSNFYNHQKSTNCIVPETCSDKCLQHHSAIKLLYDCRTTLKSSEQPNVSMEEPTWFTILETANQVVDKMQADEKGNYTLIGELPLRNPHIRLKPYENCPTVQLAKDTVVNGLLSKCQQSRRGKRPLTPTTVGSSSRQAKVSRTRESLPE